jgi:hypothetical protein
VSQDENIDYKQSIKFEMLRAEFAFSEFYRVSSARLANPEWQPDEKIKLHHFDAYARWCGHMYEAFKAFLIINPEVAVGVNTRDVSKFDAEMQKETTNIISSMDFNEGEIQPVLEASFSTALRQIRNKCSFHCTTERSEASLLQNFLNQHHNVLLVIYMKFRNTPEYIGLEGIDTFGEIEKFFDISTLVGSKS